MKIKKSVEVTLNNVEVDSILTEYICKQLSVRIDDPSQGFNFKYVYVDGNGARSDIKLDSVTMTLQGDK